MIPNTRFEANQDMTGAFAKFSNWNESIYLQLCDELPYDEKILLKDECNQYSSPRSYYYAIIDKHYEDAIRLLESYKGHGTIKTKKRTPQMIYCAVILTQFARMAYSILFYDQPSIETIPEFCNPREGNVLILEKAVDLILGESQGINYWPFNV